jgi:Cu(I)/Ag(I) efflux system membrane protein CusA/SilA
VDDLKRILVPTPTGQQIPMGQLADFTLLKGPMVIKTEGTRPNAWVYIDIKTSDIGTYVRNAQKIVAEKIKLPTGYSLIWSGEYEYMEHASARLMAVIPMTLFIIFLIIYLNTKSFIKVAIIFLAVPFSLVGTFWLLYLLNYNLSIAVWVGIIALAGLDAETGVVMLLYLDVAYKEFYPAWCCKKSKTQNNDGFRYCCRSCPYYVEQRYWRRRNEKDCGSNARRCCYFRVNGTRCLPGYLLLMEILGA